MSRAIRKRLEHSLYSSRYSSDYLFEFSLYHLTTSTVNILPCYKKHSMGLWSLNFISFIWHLKLSSFNLTSSIILLPQELESRAEILFSIASIAHHSVHLTKSCNKDVDKKHRQRRNGLRHWVLRLRQQLKLKAKASTSFANSVKLQLCFVWQRAKNT